MLFSFLLLFLLLLLLLLLFGYLSPLVSLSLLLFTVLLFGAFTYFVALVAVAMWVLFCIQSSATVERSVLKIFFSIIIIMERVLARVSTRCKFGLQSSLI